MAQVTVRPVVRPIFDGPSKMDLMFALFGNEDWRPTVRFQTSLRDSLVKMSIEVEIDGVNRVEDADDSWTFTGKQKLSSGQYREVSGQYNSQNRTGTLKIFE